MINFFLREKIIKLLQEKSYEEILDNILSDEQGKEIVAEIINMLEKKLQMIGE